jgi:hypothetical protein
MDETKYKKYIIFKNCIRDNAYLIPDKAGLKISMETGLSFLDIGANPPIATGGYDIKRLTVSAKKSGTIFSRRYFYHTGDLLLQHGGRWFKGYA